MDPVTLRTPRLVLRPPAVDDVDAITTACEDPAIQRYVPVPVPYARDDAVSYVTGFCADGWASGDRLTWAVLEGGQLVGTVGLHAIAHGAAEIGYWLAPGARGRGIIREAAAAVVDHGFDAAAELGLARIGWRAYAGNTGSAPSPARSASASRGSPDSARWAATAARTTGSPGSSRPTTARRRRGRCSRDDRPPRA